MFNDVNYDRRRFLRAVVMTIAASELGTSGSAEAQPGKINPAVEGELPSLGGATEWLNSQPFTKAGLRGKSI